MITLTETFLLFLPVFLAVNLLAALPNEENVKVAMKTGLRHFVRRTAYMVVICGALFYALEWWIGSGGDA